MAASMPHWELLQTTKPTVCINESATQGLLIGFFGSGLYFAVDRYEPDRALAFMLKLLVVMWCAAAVLHCTGLFGYGFF